jgi:hypothetical protein
MAEDIDFNKIAADFLQENLDRFVDAGKDIIKGATNKLRLRLDSTYRNYLTTILKRHSRVKSFFIRTEPVYLYNFYVPLSVATQQTKLDRPQIRDIVKISPFTIISGTAGSGKSMFMRHLLLNALLTKNKVPVYIELRQLNTGRINLRDAVANTLDLNGLRLSNEYVEKALEAGHFVLLLDGFDEIKLNKHGEAKRELRIFAEKYCKNWIVVASRPDIEIEGLHGFAMLTIQPLGLNEACELIQKLPFYDELKDKFLKDLRRDLYRKHESFLSNPLLLSIMLLTYGQSADIPTKMNVFYNQAYEAMFQRHDALKCGFQRERRTKLDIQDFAKAFSVFCLQTYDKGKYQFSRMEALKYIDKSKVLTLLNYNSEEFLKDILQAVCLMLEDGLLIVFDHRSFQEYFTALFIAQSKPEIQKRLIEKYSKKIRTDNVIDLLYEMRPDVVERYYILPNIKLLRKFIKVKKKVGITHYTRYLKGTYTYFDIQTNTILGVFPQTQRQLRFSDLIYFTLKACGRLVGWTDFSSQGDKAERDFYKVYKNRHIETKKLSYRDPFVQQLAEKGQYFSLNTLRMVVEIGELLEQKQLKAEASLEEILKS